MWSEFLTNLTISNKIPIILINGLLYIKIFFLEYLRFYDRQKNFLLVTHLVIPFLLWEKYSLKNIYIHSRKQTLQDNAHYPELTCSKVASSERYFKEKLFCNITVLQLRWSPLKCKYKDVHFNFFKNLTPS